MPKAVDYDAVAPAYDRRYADHEYPGIEEVLDAFVEPGHTVLEVGCGTGHWVERLMARRCTSYGADPSRGMLERAASRVGAAPLVRARGEALPFRASCFDRLVVINALHHFDDPPRFAHEARRVLKQAGQAVILGLDLSQGRDDWYVYRYFARTAALDRARYPSVARIEGWLRQAGFAETWSRVGHHIQMQAPAKEYLESGALTKASTSQLTLLTDSEFEGGVRAIRDDIERSEARGEQLVLRADLHIYATFGRLDIGPR